jgi:signal-transduction protein with cAMP-binding, CBS, and nucleotidyltransferase domain
VVEAQSTHLAPLSVTAMRLPRPVWLDDRATLRDVASMMATASVSAVIVGQDAAIVTERDLVCAVARGDGAGTPAVELATHETARYPDDGPVVGALAEMLHAGLRHLVIVDRGGVPCAVLPLSAAAAFVLDLAEVPSWVSALRVVLRVEDH